MAENNFPQLVKAFIVITLFAFILLAIVIQFAGNYNQDTTEISERIGLETINSTLENTKSTAEGWKESFQSSNIFSIIAGVIVTGVFTLANTMANFILFPFEIFGNIMNNVLGVPLVVVNVISVLIILTIIFGIWSLIKRGQ